MIAALESAGFNATCWWTVGIYGGCIALALIGGIATLRGRR